MLLPNPDIFWVFRTPRALVGLLWTDRCWCSRGLWFNALAWPSPCHWTPAATLQLMSSRLHLAFSSACPDYSGKSLAVYQPKTSRLRNLNHFLALYMRETRRLLKEICIKILLANLAPLL